MKVKIISQNNTKQCYPRSRSQSDKIKNTPNFQTYIYLGREANKFMGFDTVVVNIDRLEIKRASIDTIRSRKVSFDRISIPYNEDLDGEYTLEKENEDLFYLVKV